MIVDVAEIVEDPVLVALSVAVPVPEVTEADVVLEASSLAVVEAVVAESVAVDSIEVESSRGSGRTTPARTALRHSSRAKRTQIRWDIAVALILCRSVGESSFPVIFYPY